MTAMIVISVAAKKKTLRAVTPSGLVLRGIAKGIAITKSFFHD